MFSTLDTNTKVNKEVQVVRKSKTINAYGRVSVVRMPDSL